MTEETLRIKLPVGRLVQGDPHKGRDRDAKGKPLVTKNGPNAGQPRTEYFIAVAVPKNGEQHWNQTEWGAQIHAFGQSVWPQGQYQQPAFAWKIDDGDSTVPNTFGRVNATTEGFAGHWIVRMSSGYAPGLYNRDGSEKILQDGAIKRGYYVEVLIGIRSNQNLQKPGIYVSPELIALNAYGEEIKGAEIDASAVGFGQSAAPAGALTTPAPALPSVAAPTVPPVPVAPVVAPPPNPAILQPPAPARKLTAAAGGATYEQLIAAGWTDETLVANGLMEA